MTNGFYIVRFVNQIPKTATFDVNVYLPPMDRTKWKEHPERDETGKFNLRMEQPQGDERHIALGQFMDAWSRVEMAISRLLRYMLSTDKENMPVLMNSLGTRGQLDVLNELGLSMFDDSSFEELSALTSRIKGHQTRRNHIVHGYWLLEVLTRVHAGKPTLVYKQTRVYDPASKQERERLEDRSNTKERSKYHFSIPRIRAVSKELHSVFLDISGFITRHFGDN